MYVDINIDLIDLYVILLIYFMAFYSYHIPTLPWMSLWYEYLMVMAFVTQPTLLPLLTLPGAPPDRFDRDARICACQARPRHENHNPNI